MTVLSTTTVPDISGTLLETGDTVVTVNGQTTGRVAEIKVEDDMGFICLRPVHQAFGPGVWYAADQVFWVARPASASKPKNAAKTTGNNGNKPAPVATKTTPARKK
ncbi:MAG: hypothetical protein AAFX76_02880 [Planctomycetota bacterium]